MRNDIPRQLAWGFNVPEILMNLAIPATDQSLQRLKSLRSACKSRARMSQRTVERHGNAVADRRDLIRSLI